MSYVSDVGKVDVCDGEENMSVLELCSRWLGICRDRIVNVELIWYWRSFGYH